MRPDSSSREGSRSKPSTNWGVRHTGGAFVGDARGSSRGMGPGPARFNQRAPTLSLPFEPHSAALPHFSPGVHVSSQIIRTILMERTGSGPSKVDRRCIVESPLYRMSVKDSFESHVIASILASLSFFFRRIECLRLLHRRLSSYLRVRHLSTEGFFSCAHSSDSCRPRSSTLAEWCSHHIEGNSSTSLMPTRHLV